MAEMNGVEKQTKALQESEWRLSRAQAIAHMGDWEWEIATNVVQWSDELYRIYGFEPHEIAPDYGLVLRQMHPDSKEEFLQAIDAALNENKPFEMNYTFFRNDGSEAVLYTTGKVVRDGLGAPLRMFGVVQDVTGKKLAEEKVQKSEEYLRNILDTVDAGFIVVDLNYRILTANRAYCEQVGVNGKQIVGKPCFEVSHKFSRPCYEEGEECSVKMAFTSGTPQVAHHQHEDAEGNKIYVETKAFPLRDASGKIFQAIEIVTDITEKRLLEAERLKVQKLEAIGTLAGGLAHDFNNLLQGVFGYISLAKMASKQNKIENTIRALAEAEEALNLSSQLTNQLLTFSKGGKPLKQETNLRTVIDNSIRFALSGSSTNYHIVEAENLWHADVDEGQITQVVQNIVLNAAQAMPEGGMVEVVTRNIHSTDPEFPRGLKGDRYVEISIRDEGIGIPEKDFGRIFDPYFSSKEKGSGLGLATSYSIVKNHGGLITVSSVLGEGSTFCLYLPASKKSHQQDQPHPVVSKPPRMGRVLIMDDEPMVLEVASEMIKMLGHQVDLAINGDDAVAKYQVAIELGSPFDAVILDLTVRGGLGGAETVGKLAAIDPEVKAVVSSGYADSAIVANFKDHGFKAFLNKPYSVEGLQGVLQALLN